MKSCVLIFLFCYLCFSCDGKKQIRKFSTIENIRLETPVYSINAVPKRIRKKPDSIFFLRRYTQLSNQFNLTVFISEIEDNFITSYIRVSVFDKNDSLRQIIRVNAEVVRPIKAVSHVRSYETRFNLNHKLEDPEYHGEIIVGDFNFDSLSDIAIVDLIPMSGTPSYTYYLQKENLTFEYDHYLTNEVGNLPQNLNASTKTFMAYYHTGCCAQTYRYFKVDEKGKCRLTYRKSLDLNMD